jgi:hypothetical protein
MRESRYSTPGISLLVLALVTVAPSLCLPQADAVDFDSDRWQTPNARITEHLGRRSLAGFAYLNDVELESGVVEVDLAVDGSRSYPGIIFHMQSGQDYEEIYIRPHRAGLYSDAIQYMPTLNGIGCWQLYNGEGYTASVELPLDQWVHLRLEFSAGQARLYVGESDAPALAVPDLKHDVTSGGIGLTGPTNGSAFFSNFEYRDGTGLAFEPTLEPEMPPGALTDWELSQPFRLGDVDLEQYPTDQALAPLEWRAVQAEPPGLVVVAREFGRTGREPDCVFARTTVRSEEPRTLKLEFGYSDVASVFLNGRLLFLGNSAYTSRDPSFLGIVGPYDVLYLPLSAGDNELLFSVAESFGGWGFLCRDGEAVFLRDDITEVHRSSDDLVTPEAVAYDQKRDVIYVSDYDVYGMADSEGGQYVSRLSVDGNLLDLRWVPGLAHPTGMSLIDDTLLVVERQSVVVVDADSGLVVDRIPITGARFPNDIAVDDEGRLYVSDSGGDAIFRYTEGAFETWLAGGEISNPNALRAHDGKLLIGNSGDNCLKAVDLETKQVDTLARFGPGNIDGIGIMPDGSYLVSQWEGRVYQVAPDGQIRKVLDTTVPGVNAADFEYLPERGLVIVPTFYSNRIVTYQLAPRG